MKKFIICFMVLACLFTASILILNNLSLSNDDYTNLKTSANDIEYRLEKPLPNINNNILNYKIIKPVINNDFVKSIGSKFGFYEQLEPSPGNHGSIGLYDGIQHLEIYNASGAMTYMIPSKMDLSITPNAIPDSSASKKIAHEYLINHDILPSDAIYGNVSSIKKVTALKSTGTEINAVDCLMQVEYDRFINNIPIIGPGNELKVYIGDNSEVVRVFIAWPDLEPESTITIKSPEQAFNDLKSGNDVLYEHAYGDKVLIKDVSLGYWINPMYQEQNATIPVYVFRGDVTDSNNGHKYEYSGYVYAA